jgi:hypothetical protein
MNKEKDLMAEQAVPSEPVSGPDSLFNRENTENSREFDQFDEVFEANSVVNSEG